MQRYCLLLLLAVLMAGCQTPAERAAVVKKDVEEMITIYGPGCEKLGYAKDTDPWRECILRLRAHDDIRYSTRPTTTTCIGQKGFYNCTSF